MCRGVRLRGLERDDGPGWALLDGTGVLAGEYRQHLTLEQRRDRLTAALNSARSRYEDDLRPHIQQLYPLYLDWRRTNPAKATERQGLRFAGYASSFKAFMGVRGASERLYAHLYAARAWYEVKDGGSIPPARFPLIHAELDSGDLTRWQQIGQALEDARTPEAIEADLQASNPLKQRDAAPEFQEARTAARERVHTLAPDAPKGNREADTLSLNAFNLIPDPVARAALHAASTGDTGPLDALSTALTPDYISFLKAVFPCWVTGDYPTTDNPNDAHHVGVGDKENRPNDETPDVFVGVARHAHSPLPFAPGSGAAHSSAYTVGNNAERLAALLRWQSCSVRAYGEYVRGADWRVWAERARGEKL